MKEKLGISMTAVRPLLWKVILLLVLTAAVQLFLGYRAAATFPGNTVESFSQFLSRCHTGLVAMAGLLVLLVILALQGCQFSGHWVSGTLQRLPTGEGTITVIYGLTHLGFLVLYWAMEVFVTAALYWFYGKSLGFPLVVAAYTTPFFHSLLPLSDWLRLLLSVLWALALASCTASFGFFQRRGSFQISPLLVTAAGLYSFSASGDVGVEVLFSVVFLFFIGWQVFLVRGEVKEHGKAED